jgi:hypothetical protein
MPEAMMRDAARARLREEPRVWHSEQLPGRFGVKQRSEWQRRGLVAGLHEGPGKRSEVVYAAGILV